MNEKKQRERDKVKYEGTPVLKKDTQRTPYVLVPLRKGRPTSTFQLIVDVK